MCKVMIFSNTAKMKKSEIDTVIRHASQAFNQNDGFGYSLIDKNTRDVFTEKFLNPQDVKSNLNKKISSEKNLFCKPIKSVTSENTRPSETIGALLLHGRISTNDKNLTNTHPINKHGWSLIHNGVVEDHGTKYDMITTNDTEHCLERLVQGIDQLEKNISGYYALGAIDPDKNLHVIRDSIASLYCSYVASIDSYIFATTQDLIQSTCKVLKYNHDQINEVQDNIYLTFNVTGNINHVQNISPRGRSEYADNLSGLSLGYDLKPDDKFSDKDEDMDCYLAEVYDYSDSSYTFLDYDGHTVDRNYFLELDDDEKIHGTVVRPDGTICCPYDYYKEKLFNGLRYG